MAVTRNERWRRRVGCKRSTPNRENSRPLKKKKVLLGERIEGDSHGDTLNMISNLPFLHEELLGTTTGIQEDSLLQELRINQEDMIPDLEDEETTADPDFSGARNGSMSVHCGTTKTHLSAEAVNSYFTDSKEQQEEPKMGATPVNENWSMAVKYDKDSHTQGKTIVGSNDKELASDAESRADADSRADRWACRVCKEVVVSIAVLPCSHLCLCWDCEFVIDDCPVCGEPKTGCFYTRSP